VSNGVTSNAKEGVVSDWNRPSAAYYRRLEQEQRALAADATSMATRDIHLEFADRYQRLAEQLEAVASPAEGNPGAY
jgi:hypothetical protein